MTDISIGGSVLLAGGIEVGTRRHASIGVISELVHMESVFAGRQATHFTAHFDGARVALDGGGGDRDKESRF